MMSFKQPKADINYCTRAGYFSPWHYFFKRDLTSCTSWNGCKIQFKKKDHCIEQVNQIPSSCRDLHIMDNYYSSFMCCKLYFLRYFLFKIAWFFFSVFAPSAPVIIYIKIITLIKTTYKLTKVSQKIITKTTLKNVNSVFNTLDSRLYHMQSGL